MPRISTKLVNLLRKMKVTSAKIEDSKIIVHLEHVPLPISRIKIVRSEDNVGSWFKERNRNIIRIDDDLKREHWILSVSVHEVCLTADTEIKVVSNSKIVSKKIKELPENIIVLSADFKDKKIISVSATVNKRGIQKVYRIKLKSGRIVEATLDHRFFDENMNVKKVSELRVGDKLLCVKLKE